MSTNYSLYGVPFFWVLALAPHFIAIRQVKSAASKGAKFDNANPRGADTATKYKQTLPPDVYGRYERGEAAHKNSMENAPFFFSAVIIGNLVGLPASTMNTSIGAYLGLRIAYAYVYVNVSNQKYSYIRTAIYFVSSGILMRVFWKAATKLALESS